MMKSSFETEFQCVEGVLGLTVRVFYRQCPKVLLELSLSHQTPELKIRV